MQRAVTAQISSRGPAAPAPLSRRGGLQHTGPAWRLHAASLFSSEPSGPFSFWPRGGDAARKAAAPQKQKKREEKAAPPAVSASETSLDIEPDFMPVGKQRFRSALEQVRPPAVWLLAGPGAGGSLAALPWRGGAHGGHRLPSGPYSGVCLPPC